MAKPVDAARQKMLLEFQAQLLGMDVAELERLTASLLELAPHARQAYSAQDALRPAARPDPRKPRRDVDVTLRVRADLRGTRPPVWRRLDLSSSLMLDELHMMLQGAFGFTDTHLHRFAVGPSIYDDDSAVYLCPFDVEDGDTDGVDEREVRLDELLVEPGDRLLYTYDFGDDWEIALKLEKVLDRTRGEPAAVCVAGRRAGPPEDCGGPWGFEELVASGEWDLEFDLEATNDEIMLALDSDHGMPPLLAELCAALPYTSADDELAALIQAAELDSVPPVDAETATGATARYRWFVERLGADGVQLTAAGYLPPALVGEIMTELRLDPGWIGAWNREDATLPVAEFRRSAQKLGLAHKSKGRLRAPHAARIAARDPIKLWSYVAERLPLGRQDSIERHACLLALLWTAAGAIRARAGFRGVRATGADVGRVAG